MKVVKEVLDDVKKKGDEAVRKYARKFDGAVPKKLEVNKKEIEQSYKKVSRETIAAFNEVIRSLRAFSMRQMKQYSDFEYTENGVKLGQRVIPLKRLGVYVPGGNYPLPSTALMCIVPAKVAGVDEIIACTPKTTPETIVAADLAGADRIFCIGGVQAIGAMAYGTETVPKVDKIVGPGNVYVTEAKRQVYGDCGIEFIAGPSELLIIADRYSNPAFIAADMLAQAEHDTNAKITLLSTSGRIVRKVEEELKMQARGLKTSDIASKSLRNKSITEVSSVNEAIRMANDIAPEHIELQVKNPKKYAKQLKNYGSLFIGSYSAVAFGDYCSGTNHVLPTSGAARYTGGLSVRDFIKIQTYQYITKKGAKRLSGTASAMAEMEGMEAHIRSIKMRENQRG